MSFTDLRQFLKHLEEKGDLARVSREVSPVEEVTIIHHRVIKAGGPALLFERVKGSPYRMVTNLFGTQERVDAVFGRAPSEIGAELAGLGERLAPPTLRNLWGSRSTLKKFVRARTRVVNNGPILNQAFEPPDLHELPILKCWPLDGGSFITLPLVHTVDPVTSVGNLGMYRLQRFDATSTGMHWQIEKGGAFHFLNAKKQGIPLNVSVFLGGPPALVLAAIAPLPEGIDEKMLAALLIGRPLDVIARTTTGHQIPAKAEFVLEGSVKGGDVRREGPFGDHFGHYSHAADYPVFRVDRVLARKDAIYPATVVGKPCQEDFFIGHALQQMTIPLLKVMRPGICDLWGYPETGFHPLAVLSVKERYPREAFKYAFSVLGEGQLSLTKVVVVVDQAVNVKDFTEVSNALYRNLDSEDGLHLIAPTCQDTLDFTGPAMNTGSRLVLIATEKGTGPLRTTRPPAPPPGPEVHPQIEALERLGDAFLMAKVKEGAAKDAVKEALLAHAVTRQYLFQVMVSNDVPLDDMVMVLWGWFTRFDPLNDLYPEKRDVIGNRVVLRFPIAIDATWKEGYPKPVAFDPGLERRVNSQWDTYGIKL